jgi:hypothetical protein
MVPRDLPRAKPVLPHRLVGDRGPDHEPHVSFRLELERLADPSRHEVKLLRGQCRLPLEADDGLRRGQLDGDWGDRVDGARRAEPWPCVASRVNRQPLGR